MKHASTSSNKEQGNTSVYLDCYKYHKSFENSSRYTLVSLTYYIIKDSDNHLVQGKFQEESRKSKVYSRAVEISIMFSLRSLQESSNDVFD